MSSEQLIFLGVLAGALVLFISGRLRVDVTAMLALLALALTGILDGNEALAGFSSEPAIIVAAVFVLSAGLASTGITDSIGGLIARASGNSEWRAIAVIIPMVALLAAVSHHLMVTAMMLPVVLKLARDRQIAASRLLMPMSLGASLGTTLTLFSAPAFLLASDLLERGGRDGLHVFSVTPIGAALVVGGLVYMLLARWMIPRRFGAADDDTGYLRLDRYYTELLVEAESRWVETSLADFQKAFEGRLEVVDWLRNGRRRRRRSATLPLKAGDVLLVRTSPDEIASIDGEPGLALHAVAKYGEAREENKPEALGEERILQAVVAPESEFVGRSVGSIDFLRNLGVVVVGLWRRDGWLRSELSRVVLREGDLLVLWGPQQTFAEIAEHRGFLMLMPFTATARQRRRAPWALGIMAATVAAAASGIVPAQIAFLTGAVAMVVSRCVDLEGAYKSIDVRIFVMIAGVIPLGIAMEKTGTAQMMADQLLVFAADWSPMLVLMALFWLAALLTQVLSDSATTVLLAPVSFSVGIALGMPPEPFVICTALGAVASFLTPLGHHGNLLILNPGQYTFGEFLRIGIPMTLLIGATSAFMAEWLWLTP